MPRITDYFGRFLRHGNAYPDRLVRLFDRRRGGWHGHEIHENTRIDGAVRRLDGHLEHYSYRSLTDHLNRMQRYADLMAQALYERGRRCGLAPGAAKSRCGASCAATCCGWVSWMAGAAWYSR